MDSYVTGQTIKSLRERKKLTQLMLANMLSVSDKAVSKWETGKGFPDITLLEPLSSALGVSVTELISGNAVINQNKSANMLRTLFYVCPVCGNVIASTGEASVSCCGVSLPCLEEDDPSAEKTAEVIREQSELLVRFDHEMTKQHYISFAAYVTSDRVQLVKLYPEGDALCRFQRCGRGYIYYFCNHHGLSKIKI